MPGKFLVAVSALIEKDGAILLLHRKHERDHGGGEWEPVSGRLEAGESPADGVTREVLEETGLEVEILRPFDTYHIFRGADREELIGITYHCLYRSGTLRLSDEHDTAKWVALGELLQSDVPSAIHRCFRLFLELHPIKSEPGASNQV